MFGARTPGRRVHRFNKRSVVAAAAVSLGVLASAAVPARADGGNALNTAHASPGNFQLNYTSLQSQLTAAANRPGTSSVDFWTTVKAGAGTTTSCGTACREWQDSANNDTLWYPQGLAGTLESNWNSPPPQQVIASGWYKRPTADDGSSSTDTAIKFLFTTTPTGTTWNYRHIPLRTADAAGATSPLTAHMGGLAWAGSAIYMASTDRIYRFDVRDMLRDADGAFLLPNAVYVDRASAPGGKARLSSLSTDWSTSPPALVSAEYSAEDDTARTTVVRWPLTSGAGLVVTNNIVNSESDYNITPSSDINRVQGVASKNGLYYFSGSLNRLDSARADSQVDRKSRTTWGVSGGIPQDLYLESGTSRLFGQTEKRTLRRVFWDSSPL